MKIIAFEPDYNSFTCKNWRWLPFLSYMGIGEPDPEIDFRSVFIGWGRWSLYIAWE